MDPGHLWSPPLPEPPGDRDAGVIVREARQAQGLTQAELGQRTGYSAAQVSRYERGIAAFTVVVLRRFAAALTISPQAFGLLPDDAPTMRGAAPAATSAPRVNGEALEDGDEVRRRRLLTHLAVTAAAAAGSAAVGGRTGPDAEADTGVLLVGRVRDAMLGLGAGSADIPFQRLPADLATALQDFHSCRYGRLADELPRLITAAHNAAADRSTDPGVNALLAEIYTLTTRMLIKLDDQQLGWLAADRARVIASGAGAPLIAAEAARNLAVLARKAGWGEQAAAIALAAADHPDLRGTDPAHAAKRGQLIMSAAYTYAKNGDRAATRELTGDAAAIAARLGGRTMLRDHGGGFSPATVTLHRISAEYAIGDPGAAIAAARIIQPASLPSIERRARYYTDTARAYAQAGRRSECLRALLAAERHAPEETHARPAIRDLISGLLVSGRTTPELRGLAARSGIT
jgi:transcriptional regulator with XRE-family HTH domain